MPELKVTWRGRPMRPHELERQICEALHAYRDLLDAAVRATANGDVRWADTIERLEVAMAVIRQDHRPGAQGPEGKAAVPRCTFCSRELDPKQNDC